jgi:hypothetical protein
MWEMKRGCSLGIDNPWSVVGEYVVVTLRHCEAIEGGAEMSRLTSRPKPRLGLGADKWR